MVYWNFFNVHLYFLLVTICESKQGEVDQSLMGNIYQNIWQNSANIMSNANGMGPNANGMGPNANGMGPNGNGMGPNNNGMGTQLDRNCFISGMQMSGLNPMQPQMAQSNMIACPCVTYDLNGCPKCQCMNQKEATKQPIKNIQFIDKQSTNVTSNKVTDKVSLHKDMATKTTTATTMTHDTKNNSRRQTTQTTINKPKTTTPIVTTDRQSTTIKTSFTAGTTKTDPRSTTIADRFSRHSGADDQVTHVYSATSVKSKNETTQGNIDKKATEKYFQSIPIFEEKSFSTAIGLGVALLFMTTVAVVFITLWRKTSRLLKREQNELYFTEKSFRQDSLTSITGNVLKGSKFGFTGISGRPPELPLRTPPLTPTAPPVLTSTPVEVARVGQTSFKLPPEDIDNKHDYLELI